jgi:hypothetical protein
MMTFRKLFMTFLWAGAVLLALKRRGRVIHVRNFAGAVYTALMVWE